MLPETHIELLLVAAAKELERERELLLAVASDVAADLGLIDSD